jgi:ribosomal protein L37AE/L43A
MRLTHKPVCPRCGSSDVSRVRYRLVCDGCGESGKAARFTQPPLERVQVMEGSDDTR